MLTQVHEGCRTVQYLTPVVLYSAVSDTTSSRADSGSCTVQYRTCYGIRLQTAAQLFNCTGTGTTPRVALCSNQYGDPTTVMEMERTVQPPCAMQNTPMLAGNRGTVQTD